MIKNCAIEVQGLTKRYDRLEAVSNLALKVEQGEMFAIVGPDGAGKTTLLKLLCGILKPDAGFIHVLGLDIKRELGEIKKHLGYLSQRFSLYRDLTVDENIEFFARIHNVKNYFERRNELLSFTRLTDARGRLADKLSGGMKQKLALACTLIHSPDIVLLDEPTTGVDPVSRREFWIILSTLLRSGITIIMSTPYLDEAERCGRVGLMNKGSFMTINKPALLKAMMTEYVFEIICTDIRKGYKLLKESKTGWQAQIFGDRLNVLAKDKTTAASDIAELFKQEDIRITSWREISPTLENTFISLLKGEEKSNE